MLSGGCCRWRWVVVGCGAVWGGAGAGPSVCVPCAQRDELLREHDNSGTFHHHLATSTPSWRYSGHSSEDTGKNGCWGFPSIELKCVLEQFVELWQYLINKSAGNLATSQAWVQFDVKVTHRNLVYLSRWSIRVHLRPMKPNWLWSWAVLDSTWLYLAHWLMDTGQCNDEVGARLISDLTWQNKRHEDCPECLVWYLNGSWAWVWVYQLMCSGHGRDCWTGQLIQFSTAVFPGHNNNNSNSIIAAGGGRWRQKKLWWLLR